VKGRENFSDLRVICTITAGWEKLNGQSPTTRYHPNSSKPLTKEKIMVLK
jgi:hypothetical protein